MENAMMFPILPGKRDALRQFADELHGPRRHEYEASQLTVTKESWFLQETPMGDFCIVHLIAQDPAAVYAALATSTEPFDVWFREQVQDCTGLDLAAMNVALPTQVFKWSRF